MILIKYATRGRANQFIDAINNIQNTINASDYVILVSADANDLSMNNDRIKDFVKDKSNVILKFGDSDSKIDAINRDMDVVQDWDMLVNMSDDMEFIAKGWDYIMLELIQNEWGDSTDYFAHFNDGRVGEALPTMSVMGRDYYKRFQYIYHPSYSSFSCDAEAMYVAMMLGKHKYFPVVLFTHNHPAWTHAKNDTTYIINSLASEYDTKNYFKRLNNYFDVPVEQRTCLPFEEHVNKH